MLPTRRIFTLILGLITLLAALPAAAQSGPCAGEMDEKSRLGLMPPACGPGPSTRIPTLAAGPSLFGPPIEAKVASWPQVLAALNLDGDAAAELPLLTDEYFAPETDHSLLVYGLEANTLTPLQQHPAGVAPAAITAGELAGGPAIVATLAGSNALAVYTGTLPITGPLMLEQPGAPDAVALGDFNGDLRPDIASVNPELDTMSLRQGNHVPFPIFATLPFPSDGFSALRAGDIDNNGYDDLVVLRGSGYMQNSVVVFFQDQESFTRSLSLTPKTGGFLPHSLAIGDLNGDGRDDIAVVAGGNAPDAFLSLFIQTDAGFSTLPPIPTFHIPGAVAIADVSHDGRADVVVFHHAWRTLSAFVQHADGSFAAPITSVVPYSGARRPDSMVIADINGDGGQDIALASRTPGLTVLTNLQGAPVAAITSPLPYSTVVSDNVLVSGTVSAGATRVQVRVKGLTDWTDTTLTGTSWTATLKLPDLSRPIWIEARAVDANGRVQDPPARVRVLLMTPLTGYAIADNSWTPNSPDRLLRFNARTGETALIGSTNTSFIHAATFLPDSNTLIAANKGYLGTVDLSTGAFTPRSQPIGKGANGSWRETFENIQGLTAEPATGKLFAVMRRANNGKNDILFKVDPATGRFVDDAFGPNRDFVSVRGTDILDDIDDLAYDTATMTLYALNNRRGTSDRLVTIDVNTGVATLIGKLNVPNMEGLALAPDGTLYGTTGSGSASDQETSDRLWIIDKTTGQATFVSAFGIESDYESLSFVQPGVVIPPAPAATPVSSFMVNANALNTAEQKVALQIAQNLAFATTVTEYQYDVKGARWLATKDNTARKATALVAEGRIQNLEWIMQAQPGVRYFTVQSSGSQAMSHQTMINYIPSTMPMAENEVIVYRYYLNVGDRLDINLNSLEGDADLIVWSQDTVQPWVSNLRTTQDMLSFQANSDGIYQLEIHSVTQVVAGLSVSLERNAEESIEQSAGIDLTKIIPHKPVLALDTLPDFSETKNWLYLPGVQR